MQSQNCSQFPEQIMRKADVSLAVLINTEAHKLQAAQLVTGYSKGICQLQFSYFPFLQHKAQLLHPALQVTFESRQNTEPEPI